MAVVLVVLASPAQAHERPDIGWHVPWAVGGPRLDSAGNMYQHPGEWPAFPVSSLRLWDTRTAWLNLEPREGAFDFSNLDAHLAAAEAAGVAHITLVLAGTPRWAALHVKDTDAPWLGPGSASPPRDRQAWRTFVATVVSRYRGRIDSYEIGNEPNLPMFWSGQQDELVALVADAATIVHASDPSAQVVAPAPLITQFRDVVDAQQLWAALAGLDLDALAFHFYPRTPGTIDYLPDILDVLRTSADRSGFESAEIWVTEANPGSRAVRSDIQTMEKMARAHSVDRWFWYAWMGGLDSNLHAFAR